LTVCNVATVLDWNHNAYNHRLLLGQLPQRRHRVLDVVCGAGSFAARLAGRVEQVDAIDRSAAMIEMARQRTPENVNCVLADVLMASPRCRVQPVLEPGCLRTGFS
jgi:ubiquinone/menaquinone biosynthesis C-methylase UbiE